MKYLVQIEVDPAMGSELEQDPAAIQKLMEAWQAHNPIGMYVSMTRRAVTVILEAPNEDAFFKTLHATWVTTESYPEVTPIVSAEEFPAIMQRLGMKP